MMGWKTNTHRLIHVRPLYIHAHLDEISPSFGSPISCGLGPRFHIASYLSKTMHQIYYWRLSKSIICIFVDVYVYGREGGGGGTFMASTDVLIATWNLISHLNDHFRCFIVMLKAKFMSWWLCTMSNPCIFSSLKTCMFWTHYSQYVLRTREGHSIVKLKTTCNGKKLYNFLSCITKIGQTLINSFRSRYTWYLLHSRNW